MAEEGDKSVFVLFDLFLYADGKKTDEEEDLLEQLGAKMKVTEEEKERMERFSLDAMKKEVDSVDEFLEEPDDDRSQLVIRAMKPFIQGKFGDKCQQARIIWNLMNLGYADDDYSQADRNVVEFLCETWDMNNTVMIELKDSMETLGSLYEQKELLENLPQSSKETSDDLKAIENCIARVQESVELTFTALDTFKDDERIFGELMSR